MSSYVHRVALLSIFLAVAQSAFAQTGWVWKDENGHTVISDQPPPASVPQSRIIRGPGSRPLVSPAVEGSSGDSPAKVESADKPKTLADQERDFEKRRKAAADAAKKAQDEQAKADQDAQRCSSARSTLSMLQSGVRIARTDDQGQRYYLDDSQRQDEINRAQAAVSQNCH